MRFSSRLRLLAAFALLCVTGWSSDIRSDEVRGAHWLTTVGTVPRVTALGVVDQSKLTCTAGNPGICELYDDTAMTGITYFWIRAGDNQGATPLVYFSAAGGGALGGINASNTLHTLGGWTSNEVAIKRNGTGLEIRLADDSALAILSAAPGGSVPAWKKYSLLAIANGVNGCANASGCWQVNGVLGADKAAALIQDVVLFQLPGSGKISDWRIKTSTACTGTATANTGLGTAANNVLFRAQAYDIQAAPAATNLTEGPTAGAGSGTSAAINIVASLITTVNNVDQLVTGCAVDFWVLYSVLP